MLLSKLRFDDLYVEIINEQEFETLGLLVSEISHHYLTFVDDLKFINLVQKESIVMVLTTAEIAKAIPASKGIVVCANPRNTFFKLHNLLSNEKKYIRKSIKTIIGNNCNISSLSYIDPNNVKIGVGVTIEEFVSIKSGTSIGDCSTVRAGSVIGSSGFEFKREDNTVIGVEHCGGVVIGSHVEIKCNTVIDRAIYPWDDTCIGDYSKLDNLIHVGHACKIKNRVMIPANSVIGGRVTIEDDSWIGIGSSIRNGVNIGKNSRVNMGAVVTKDVPENGAVSGNFAIDHAEFIKNLKKDKEEENHERKIIKEN